MYVNVHQQMKTMLPACEANLADFMELNSYKYTGLPYLLFEDRKEC